jgi:peptide/nickel transport system permease protein
MQASSDEPIAADLTVQDRSSEGLWALAWRRFRRHKLAMFGLIMLTVLTLLSVVAPILSPHSPYALNLTEREQPPSPDHWFGTDRTGRDVWTRAMLGGRVSLSVGLVSMTISTLIGTVVGSLSGYFGGWVDMLFMRLTDMVMSFPSLVIIITLVAVIGPSIYNSMFAIGVLGWPGLARLVRGQFLSLREQDFVTAAECIGAPRMQIIFRHILPNAVGPIIVASTFGVASAILLEAGLSFLGLGVQIPTPSWGNMLRDA